MTSWVRNDDDGTYTFEMQRTATDSEGVDPDGPDTSSWVAIGFSTDTHAEDNVAMGEDTVVMSSQVWTDGNPARLYWNAGTDPMPVGTPAQEANGVNGLDTALAVSSSRTSNVALRIYCALRYY